MNRQHLLSRLARRGWPVIYSTGAMSVWDRSSPEWRTAHVLAQQEIRDGVRLDLAGRFPLAWPTHPRYDKWALGTYCRALKRRAGVSTPQRTIAYLFWPQYFPYAQALGGRYVVYHAVDAYSHAPGWSTRFAEFERLLVNRADLVIATTEEILAQLPAGGRARRRVLHNGADTACHARGQDMPCPLDLAHIPRPWICYAGCLNRKVDFALIAEIATRRPDWHWVMVGATIEGSGHPSQDEVIAPGYRTCTRLPNVHFLGYRTRQDLPAYTGHADINVMCYRRDGGGWWTSCYPLKMHEYLACRKPIVSVPLPAVMPFAHVIALARTADDWMQALDHALYRGGVGTPAERQAVADQNTWDERVDRLESWLLDMVAQQ